MHYFLFFFCFILLIIINKSNIIIPFKVKDTLNKNIESKQENSSIQNMIFNAYYSKIEIGTPFQIIEAKISSSEYGISLKEGSCLTPEYYNKKYSSSIVEKTHCEDQNIYNFYKEISVNETISFQYSNKSLNSKKKIKDFPLIYFKEISEKEKNLIKRYGRKMQLYNDLFGPIDLNKNFSYLERNKDGKACLTIGMRLSSTYNCLPNSNIVSYLNKYNIIKDTNWGIKFYNKQEKEEKKNDGEFILGSLPHEYSPNNFKKEQFSLSNVLYYKNIPNWQIQFSDNYFFPIDFKLNEKINLDYLNKNIPQIKEIIDKKIVISINSIAQFDFNLKVILGTKKYYNLINEYFFSKYPDKCLYNIEEKKYGIFKCEKDFNTEKFPSLFFYHQIYNYTFELNHKDLFEDKNDKKYFLIVFDEMEPKIWKFGTIFLRKYFFVFNTNEKTIGFYNKKINTYEWKKKLFNNILWIIFIILSGLGGFFLGKKIYYRFRGRRINELNDNFIYNTKKEPQFALEMSSQK